MHSMPSPEHVEEKVGDSRGWRIPALPLMSRVTLGMVLNVKQRKQIQSVVHDTQNQKIHVLGSSEF